MTVVINLFAGSGVGKSTCAADLFAEMKHQKIHVEHVQEYVKKWAWQGRNPTGLDQFYIAAKQAHAESDLYGKVDYIVTDSPILLSGFYEQYHLKKEIVFPAIRNFLNYSRDEHGVKHVNFFLSRNKEFDPRGRFEKDVAKAKAIDEALHVWLKQEGYDYFFIDVPDRDRPEAILSYLKEASGST